MSEDIIQLPKVDDVKKLLIAAKRDISTAIQQESELGPQGQFVQKVIDLVDQKLKHHTDLNKIQFNEKVDVAAHLTFLQGLIEDFFNIGMEDEDADDDFEDMSDVNFEEKPNGLPMKKNSGGGCCGGGGGHHHNH